jgi:PTH1 family peptidyl-tRNA hydrolase
LFLICGLGNKGAAYRDTRHNVGYLVLDRFSALRSIPFSRKIAGCAVGEGDGVILAKPDTFMNLSGGPVSALMRKKGVAPDHLLVVHDDLDMELARVRIRWDGGDGGHKGVRSIAEALGTNLFYRIKIGIGRDPAMTPEDYVLSRFKPDERVAISEGVERAAEAIGVFLADGVEKAMSRFNSGKET